MPTAVIAVTITISMFVAIFSVSLWLSFSTWFGREPFVMQGNMSEADTPTIRLGTTPSRLISDSPPSFPIFTPDTLLATTLPICSDLEQAQNMLACIPSGLVIHPCKKRKLLPKWHRPVGQCQYLFSVALSQTRRHQLMLWDHGYGAVALRGVPIYAPDFTGTRVYPRGMARLSWPGWLVKTRLTCD